MKIKGRRDRHSSVSSRAALVRSAVAAGIAATIAGSAASFAQEVAAPRPTATQSGGEEVLDEVRVIGSAAGAVGLEQLRDVPQSISLVTGENLDRFLARDIKDLVNYVGNISWSPGNSRTSSISIRGVGKQSQTDAMDPSVGVIIDEVPYAYNPLATFGFFDIEAIEVSRGPQGTAQGKNASVGVIKVTTKAPSLYEWESTYQLTLGQNNRAAATVATGGPLVDGSLAWRASVYADKGDGDYANRYNTDHSFMNRDKAEGRLQLLWVPQDNFTARFIADIKPRTQEFYNGWSFSRPSPTQYANGAPYTSLTSEQRLQRRWFNQGELYDWDWTRDYYSETIYHESQRPLVTRSSGLSAELNWDLGRSTLTSISSWRDYEFRAGNDEGTPFDITKNGGGFVVHTQRSHELRFASEAGARFGYSAGAYFLQQDTLYVSGGNANGGDAGAWFANNARYNRLDSDPAGRYLLANSLWNLHIRQGQEIENETVAAFVNLNWRLSDNVTLVTGLRFSNEDRRNWTWKRITSQGYAPELNPVRSYDVELGGFDSNGAGALTADNTPQQLALADFTANKYFGVASYAALTPLQQQLIADAKGTRSGVIGQLWADDVLGTFKDTQPTYIFSPTWQLSDNVSAYFAAQYTEKTGIALVTNGYATPAEPEETSSRELGIKASLLDNRWVFGADLFITDVKNYQQGVLIYDPYTTLTTNDGETYYTSQTGNAEEVRAQGLEIDSTFSATDYFTIRLSASYNDAYYRKFTKSATRAENRWPGSEPYEDVSGETLPGASKIQANLGFDYRRPIGGDRTFHLSWNTAYNSKAKSDSSLSEYSWIPGHSISDAAIGYGWGDHEVNLLVRNALNDDTPLSLSWTSWTPAIPRWVGVSFSGRL